MPSLISDKLYVSTLAHLFFTPMFTWFINILIHYAATQISMEQKP